MSKAKSSKMPNIFYVHRTPGRFSPKSFMYYSKVGPHFSKLTAQQEKVKKAGIACKEDMIKAGKDVHARRRAAGKCIREQFGYKE